MNDHTEDRRPICIWNERQAALYYDSPREIQDAWNAYAQTEATAFDNDPSRDSYDSTNVFVSTDPETGRITDWAPDLTFERWRSMLSEEGQNNGHRNCEMSAPSLFFKPLAWKPNGWLEAFAQPEGLGLWYSISPKTPVRGPGEPPFKVIFHHGVPGGATKIYLGEFPTLDEAKTAAQTDYDKRMTALTTPVFTESNQSEKGAWVHQAMNHMNNTQKFSLVWGDLVALIQQPTNAGDPIDSDFGNRT